MRADRIRTRKIHCVRLSTRHYKLFVVYNTTSCSRRCQVVSCAASGSGSDDRLPPLRVGNCGYKSLQNHQLNLVRHVVRGDPGVSKDQSLCQTSWGGAPSPMASRSLFGHLKKSTKVALGPSATEADAHTFASLRSLQPCVLPFLLSRAAALEPTSSGAAAAAHC